MKLIAFLALKDLARDRKIAALVIMLLAFSYINLTFFPAFLNGLSDTFQSEIVDTATSHIIIQPSSDSNQLYLNFESSTRKKIDLIPGVVKSSSHIALSGTVFFKGKEMGIRIEGITPSEEQYVTTIHEKVLKGTYLNDEDNNEIIMGELVAGRKIEDLIGQQGGFGATEEGLGGVDIGKRVRIRFSNGVEREYKIKAIAGSQGFSIVSQSVFMTKEEAEDVLGIDDKASSILVRLNDRKEADRYKNLILELGIPNAQVRTWEEASTFAAGINQTFGIVTVITTMVGIIIVISTIGIVVFINTSRKKRIIGVLKAIGAQKNEIMMIFLLESLFFGIIGTLIGIAVVYLFVFVFTISPIVLPIGALKPILPIETAASSVVIMIVSSIIAGYLPARMAAKQEILETIKTVE